MGVFGHENAKNRNFTKSVRLFRNFNVMTTLTMLKRPLFGRFCVQNWHVSVLLKICSLDFSKILHDPSHSEVGKSDFFFQGSFYYYPNWSILANQDCIQIFFGKTLERTFVSFCKIFAELFSNEHITLDMTLLYNEINSSFLSTN